MREAAAGVYTIDTPPTPLDVAFERETTLIVRSALAEVADSYREVLVLYYVQGRSVSEVATGLGISEDLVKQRLTRGRRALRISLERRVEDALGQLRPSHAFTATVMVAVASASARTAGAAGAATTTGKALLAMKTTKLVVVGVLVILAALVAWHWRSSERQRFEQHASETGSAANAATPVASAAASPIRTGSPRVRKFANREMRDKLVLAIRAAHEQRLSKAPKSAAPSEASPRARVGSAEDETETDDPDADYIRDAMSALLPMVVDCYKQARLARPALAGTLVVNFTIEGEPGVGGVVTESAIDPEKSEIKDSDLGQCVEETMFALEIDPPANGGTVKVTFPFTFRPKE